MRWPKVFLSTLFCAGIVPVCNAQTFASCSLDPRIEQKLCRQEEGSAHLCFWVPILGGLAAGDFDRSSFLLAEKFELEEALARRLTASASLAMPGLLADPDCGMKLLPRLMKMLEESELLDPDRCTPETLYFNLYLFDAPRGFVTHFERDLPPALRPVLAKAAISFREVLEVLDLTALFPSFERHQKFFETASLGPIDRGEISVKGASELREIEEVLAQLAAGRLEDGRDRLRAVAASRSLFFTLRAAYALGRSGFLVEARQLLEAGKAPGDCAGDDPRKRFPAALAGWLEAWISMELGQVAESRSLLADLKNSCSEDAREFLDILPQPQPGGTRFFSTPWGAMPELVSLLVAVERPDVRAAIQESFRSISPDFRMERPRNQDGTRVANELEVALKLSQLDLAGGLAAAEELIRNSPSYRNLKWFFSIAGMYAGTGQSAKGSAALARAIDLLEMKLGPLQDEEIARSFIDSQVFENYAFAVEFGAWWDGREGLEYAERGRAFSLRRLLGERQRSEAATKFPGQPILEAKIAELETARDKDVEALRKLRHRFESERLRQRLADESKLRLAVATPSRLQLESRDASIESLIVYYDTFGKVVGAFGGETENEGFSELPGRLWVWQLEGKRLYQRQVPLEPGDRENIDCFTQALRWQEAVERARSAARGRGVEIVTGCPGAAPGADPAAELYRMLISEVEVWIARGPKRLVIVPHGKLNSVPFAALKNPETGRRLAEDFEISIVPSLDVLDRLRDRRRSSFPG